MIQVRCPKCREIYNAGTDHKCGVQERNQSLPATPPPGLHVTRAEFELLQARVKALEIMLADRPKPKRDRAAYMRERRAKGKK